MPAFVALFVMNMRKNMVHLWQGCGLLGFEIYVFDSRAWQRDVASSSGLKKHRNFDHLALDE
jgi:hypothetical protein